MSPDVSPFTVYVDSREQKPYTFNRFPEIETVEQTLRTGDYCVANDGEHDGEYFCPNYAVERKSKSDFTESITWERSRFEDELRRADGFEHRMPVIVEKPLLYYRQNNHYRNVSPASIVGTAESHPKQFYMDYFFERSRQTAEALTKEFLIWRSRKIE
jgi:ERCC4-type nuclease